ncbi:MAG: hypothetical protein LBQ78_04000 [Tannerellaceae bacterium]|jgi:hypothetical protein|nr:hypothetical protein [Tannerellaceae bacterium]
MGLFDFLKPTVKEVKKNQETLRLQTSEKAQTPETHLKDETYSGLEVVQPQKAPKHVKEAPKRQPEKNSLSDFFHVDIDHIFKHEPSLAAKSAGANGEPVEMYTLDLKERELSTFFKVQVIRFEDETYNLVFISDINEIKEDMKEFIHYCTTQFGPDFMRKEDITDEDYRDMTLGVFSRIWHDRVCIGNTHFSVSLTLYHINKRIDAGTC